MVEKIYYTDSNYITLDIPSDGNVGIYMSGGADSSMVAYLLADTIMKRKLKTKVFPITTELLDRPYSLKHATNVIHFIKQATGFEFDLHLTFCIPTHLKRMNDEERNLIFSRYANDFIDRFELLTIFSGNTANPPIDLVQNTEYAERPSFRDDEQWRQEQEMIDSLRLPFIRSDKRVVGALYKKFDLLHTLFPLTRSCEAEMKETDFFEKDCYDVRVPEKTCWWCLERAYGFGPYFPDKFVHRLKIEPPVREEWMRG